MKKGIDYLSFKQLINHPRYDLFWKYEIHFLKAFLIFKIHEVHNELTLSKSGKVILSRQCSWQNPQFVLLLSMIGVSLVSDHIKLSDFDIEINCDIKTLLSNCQESSFYSIHGLFESSQEYFNFTG